MIEDLDLFEPYVKKSFDLDYRKYLISILNDDKVSKKDGYTCYVKHNLNIVALIPKDKIVVDVGCSFGLQHLLYQKHRGWIGIQAFKEGNNVEIGHKPILKVFSKNATIIGGLFKDVWQQLNITEENKNQFFGVANCSLWNDPTANKEDIEIFKNLFPVNYWVSDEGNNQIKY